MDTHTYIHTYIHTHRTTTVTLAAHARLGLTSTVTLAHARQGLMKSTTLGATQGPNAIMNLEVADRYSLAAPRGTVTQCAESSASAAAPYLTHVRGCM